MITEVSTAVPKIYIHLALSQLSRPTRGALALTTGWPRRPRCAPQMAQLPVMQVTAANLKVTPKHYDYYQPQSYKYLLVNMCVRCPLLMMTVFGLKNNVA